MVDLWSVISIPTFFLIHVLAELGGLRTGRYECVFVCVFKVLQGLRRPYNVDCVNGKLRLHISLPLYSRADFGTRCSYLHQPQKQMPRRKRIKTLKCI